MVHELQKSLDPHSSQEEEEELEEGNLDASTEEVNDAANIVLYEETEEEVELEIELEEEEEYNEEYVPPVKLPTDLFDQQKVLLRHYAKETPTEQIASDPVIKEAPKEQIASDPVTHGWGKDWKQFIRWMCLRLQDCPGIDPMVVLVDVASACITGLIHGQGQGPGLAVLEENIKGVVGGLPPTPAQTQTILRRS